MDAEKFAASYASPTDTSLSGLIYKKHSGAVETSPQDPNYLGAESHTNNTAELTAIAQALIWLSNENVPKITTLAQALKYRAQIRSDSEYSLKSITGEYNGKKNTNLIKKCRELYSRELTRRRAPMPTLLSEGDNKLYRSTERAGFGPGLTLKWVKGHDKDVLNSEADELAVRAAHGDFV